MFKALMVMLCCAQFGNCEEIDLSIQNVLFKISATIRRPDMNEPWKKGSPHEISGTGFLIDGRRVLTNSHMIQHASQIYVQPEQSDQQILATVEFISHDVDLAILRLDDETPIDGREPIAFDTSLQQVRSEVTAYGYPKGGSQLSVTKGIVSRIEYDRLTTFSFGLRTQIDAAINSGNSGGPVFSNGKIVGVAYSGAEDSDNIGYIIPASEVQLFLDDIADGTSDGRKYLWEDLASVENPSLRKRLKMPTESGGLIISRIWTESQDYPLLLDDVITRIGEHRLDAHGQVQVQEGVMLDFRYYIPLLARENKLPLTIWRQGREFQVDVPLCNRPKLLLEPLQDKYPSYAIFGPLVFEAASMETSIGYCSSEDWATRLAQCSSPFIGDLLRPPACTDQELIFIPMRFLTSRLSKGYSNPSAQTLSTINGQPIRNLRHLVETLRDCQDDYLEFAFHDHFSETLTFDRRQFLSSTEDILVENSIRKQVSDDLERVWNNKIMP